MNILLLVCCIMAVCRLAGSECFRGICYLRIQGSLKCW